MTKNIVREAAGGYRALLCHRVHCCRFVGVRRISNRGRSSALALAAVVALHGSLLARSTSARLHVFDGKSLIIPRADKITVAADFIVCKMSEVDVRARSCDLAFKSHKAPDRT